MTNTKRLTSLLLALALSLSLVGCGNRRGNADDEVEDPTEGLPTLSEAMTQWGGETSGAPIIQATLGITEELAQNMEMDVADLLDETRPEDIKWNGKKAYVALFDNSISNKSILAGMLNSLVPKWYVQSEGYSASLSLRQPDDDKESVNGGRALSELLSEGLAGEDAMDVLKQNLNDVIFQLRIIFSYDVVQTSGSADGIQIDGKRVIVDLMSLNQYSDQNMAFEPKFDWSVNVIYGGTMEALQRLGVYNSDFASGNVTTLHAEDGSASWLVRTEQRNLKTANLTAKDIIGETAYKLLPSESYCRLNSKLVPYGDGKFGVQLVYDLKNNAPTDAAVSERDNTWLRGQVYLTMEFESEWNCEQQNGNTKGVDLFNNSLKLNTSDMSFDRTYQFEFNPNLEASRKPSNVGPSFVDVHEGDWFYNAVIAANEEGIVSGVGNGEFKPNNTLTIAEWAVMMARAMGESYVSEGTDYWAKGAVEIMINKGLWLDLDPKHPLKPVVEMCNVPITREAAVYGLAMVVVGEDHFITRTDNINIPDKMDIDPQYLVAICTAYQNGLITGNVNGEVMPKQPLTRAQFCQMLYNSGLGFDNVKGE